MFGIPITSLLRMSVGKAKEYPEGILPSKKPPSFLECTPVSQGMESSKPISSNADPEENINYVPEKDRTLREMKA